MRGVSAEGFAASLERLEAVAGSGGANRLGDELFAVTAVAATQGSLRRALTDPAADADAKRRLAHDVLDGKVGEPTVDVVTVAAAARWSSSSDFVATLEAMGVQALMVAAERDGNLANLEDELFRFGRVVAGDPELRDAVTNKQVALGRRQQLVAELLEGKASYQAQRLATQAIATQHRSMEVALDEYQKAAAARQRRTVAVVRSAIPLTDEERERLTAALGRQYEREIHLNVVVDPEVLGGIRVEVGDDVIDGTVTGRLDDARRRMTG